MPWLFGLVYSTVFWWTMASHSLASGGPPSAQISRSLCYNGFGVDGAIPQRIQKVVYMDPSAKTSKDILGFVPSSLEPL